MTYTDSGKLSPETQSAIEQEVRTLLRVRFFSPLLWYIYFQMSRPSACLIIQFDNVYWWKYTGGWKYLQVLNVAATSNLCVSKCFGNCHAQVVRSKLVLLGSSVCALTLMFGQDLYFASLIHRKKVWLCIVSEQMWMFLNLQLNCFVWIHRNGPIGSESCLFQYPTPHSGHYQVL